MYKGPSPHHIYTPEGLAQLMILCELLRQTTAWATVASLPGTQPAFNCKNVGGSRWEPGNGARFHLDMQITNNHIFIMSITAPQDAHKKLAMQVAEWLTASLY